VVWGSFAPEGPTIQPKKAAFPNNAQNGAPEKCNLLYKPSYPYFQSKKEFQDLQNTEYINTRS
jgi:hypothetical protein